MNQRQATVSTILAVLQERGVEYELNSQTPISEVLTPEDKHKVRETLFTMFRFGQVDYKETFQAQVDDDKALKNYISGLTNNWIRKAPEFNNDQAYQAKNPGTRQGAQDEQIREMKKLLSATTDPEAKVLINQAIESRQAEIKPSISVNLDAIPAALRAKLGL